MSCSTQLSLMNGTIYGAIFTNGVAGDFRRLYDTASVTITKEQEKAKAVYCSEAGTDSRDLISEPVLSTKYSLAIESIDMNKRMRELYAGSAATALVQTAETGQTFQVASTTQGVILDIGAYKISNTSLGPTGGGTAYIEGVDYDLKATFGTLQILEGGAIPDGTDVTLTYDKAAISDGFTVNAGGGETPTFHLKWQGENQEGRDVIIDMPKVQLSADGERILKAETKDYEKATITGSLLKPTSGEVYTEISF